MTSALTAILNSVVVGLLRREVTVELFNISCSGCLLESASAIPMGTLGTLCVEIEGTVYMDDVRVSRCLVVPGGGERHHVGAEFLSLQRLGQQSLRLYAASLGSQRTEAEGFAVGRVSRSPLKIAAMAAVPTHPVAQGCGRFTGLRPETSRRGGLFTKYW